MISKIRKIKYLKQDVQGGRERFISLFLVENRKTQNNDLNFSYLNY